MGSYIIGVILRTCHLKIFRRQSSDRVVNPLENNFFNELDFEENPPYTLVFHGLEADWMEQVGDWNIWNVKILIVGCRLYRRRRGM